MAAGTAKGFAVFAGVAPEIIRASAHEAETRGFGSFWVNHPGPVDGLGSLAPAPAETQRIDRGAWGVALGPGAVERLHDEGGRYAAIPAYGAHFERMGVKPVDTAIAATSPAGIQSGLAAWQGAVDEIVLRAIVAHDTVDDHLTLLRAL